MVTPILKCVGTRFDAFADAFTTFRASVVTIVIALCWGVIGHHNKTVLTWRASSSSGVMRRRRRMGNVFEDVDEAIAATVYVGVPAAGAVYSGVVRTC